MKLKNKKLILISIKKIKKIKKKLWNPQTKQIKQKQIN